MDLERGIYMYHTKNRDGFEIISAEGKRKKKIYPYLSIALTKSCPCHCFYCGEGGELTASKVDSHSLKKLMSSIRVAEQKGITKFRVTGGEPFTYPEIEDLIFFLQDTGRYVLINTSGTVALSNQFIMNLKENVHFAVHMDTLNESVFKKITSSSIGISNTLENIEKLSSAKRLLRLNCVLTKFNQDEIFELINFCKSKRADLKIFDITQVPHQYKNKKMEFVSLKNLEKQLEERSQKIVLHEYTKSFGTPCKIYTIDGVNVTAKSVRYGSRYDREGYCKDCPHFPCDEGLYDLLYYPDETLWGCRWYDEQFERGSFENQLDYLIECFQRSKWYIEGKIVKM